MSIGYVTIPRELLSTATKFAVPYGLPFDLNVNPIMFGFKVGVHMVSECSGM